MSVIVKICGLATEAGLDAALACGADMAGFVFFDKSPRHVSLELAANLGRRAARRTCKVLVTVDADDASLAAAIKALGPGLLQLHGSETPERVAAIRARFGLPVMKAIGIFEEADLALVPVFDGVADICCSTPRRLVRQQTARAGDQLDWSLLGSRKKAVAPRGDTSTRLRRTLAQTSAGRRVSSGQCSGVKDGTRSFHRGSPRGRRKLVRPHGLMAVRSDIRRADAGPPALNSFPLADSGHFSIAAAVRRRNLSHR
jgi:phosphoribosylanthranilate isomerase